MTHAKTLLFFIVIAMFIGIMCYRPAPMPSGPPSSTLSHRNQSRVQQLAADMRDPNRQFPGKPYYGESHAEVWDKAQRGYWYTDVDRKWRDGMMPRPPHEPNQMVSMPY